ncbi:hypothetical protein ACFC1L_43685 [Streptomyces sp. NPDC056210]|uniref:hypothetical protein n=1 Tax=Streptomyces sp. NPDC056210 TaxID=3345746 RepID=UPI0035D9D705
MGAISREVKDGFRYDEVPWQRFRHFYGPGEDIPGLLATLASGDAEAADGALQQLWTDLHHQGGTIAVGALAVPFLLRIAVAGRPGLRAQTLRLIAEIGRCQHMGDGSREGLLQVAEEPLMIEGSTMCPVDWTIQAARQAVTDDLYLVLPLLSDPDPEVRSVTAYVLAAATGELSHVSSALRSRLAKEDDAAARVSLILAIAQLAREHQYGHAPQWARDLWSDPGRPPEVRIGAGLAVSGHRPRPRRAPRPAHRPRHPSIRRPAPAGAMADLGRPPWLRAAQLHRRNAHDNHPRNSA